MKKVLLSAAISATLVRLLCLLWRKTSIYVCPGGAAMAAIR